MKASPSTPAVQRTTTPRLHEASPQPELRPAAEFNVRQARDIVGDLFAPNPRIFWLDMILSTAVAYGTASVYFTLPITNPLKIVALIVSGLALFRVGAFIHEIQHFSGHAMRRFTTGWNLLCGIPMLSPSFLYDNHASHHSRATYGTEHDGEYLPLGHGAWGHFAMYVAQAICLPLVVAFRFLFLTPLALASRAWRHLVLQRFSYYGINPHYRHTPPDPLPRSWVWLETACMIRAWMIPGLIVAGVNPPIQIVQLYVLAAVSLGLNYVRNVAAHRYRSEGAPMTYAEQLLDSINITGHPIWTELLFPVGLRYHALHHIFPTLPYHNLGKAHRRLMEQLPADSPYRRTVFPSFHAAVRQLWADARAERLRRSQPAAQMAA